MSWRPLTGFHTVHIFWKHNICIRETAQWSAHLCEGYILGKKLRTYLLLTCNRLSPCRLLSESKSISVRRVQHRSTPAQACRFPAVSRSIWRTGDWSINAADQEHRAGSGGHFRVVSFLRDRASGLCWCHPDASGLHSVWCVSHGWRGGSLWTSREDWHDRLLADWSAGRRFRLQAADHPSAAEWRGRSGKGLRRLFRTVWHSGWRL